MKLEFPTQTTAIFTLDDREPITTSMIGQANGWRLYGPEDLHQAKRASLVALAKTLPLGGFKALGASPILRTDGVDHYVGALHAGGSYAEGLLDTDEARASCTAVAMALAAKLVS